MLKSRTAMLLADNATSARNSVHSPMVPWKVPKYTVPGSRLFQQRWHGSEYQPLRRLGPSLRDAPIASRAANYK